MDANTQLIICAFDGEDKADEAKAAMKRIDDELDTIKLGNIAVVKKMADGSIAVRDAHDSRQTLSRIAAPVAGAVTWFVSLVAGAPASVTAGAAEVEAEAALTRWMADRGFPDAALRAVGEKIDAGHSAMILLVKPEEKETVIKELEGLGGHILEHELTPELVARLSDGA